jgi:hypothetical protein
MRRFILHSKPLRIGLQTYILAHPARHQRDLTAVTAVPWLDDMVALESAQRPRISSEAMMVARLTARLSGMALRAE